VGCAQCSLLYLTRGGKGLGIFISISLPPSHDFSVKSFLPACLPPCVCLCLCVSE